MVRGVKQTMPETRRKCRPSATTRAMVVYLVHDVKSVKMNVQREKPTHSSQMSYTRIKISEKGQLTILIVGNQKLSITYCQGYQSALLRIFVYAGGSSTVSASSSPPGAGAAPASSCCMIFTGLIIGGAALFRIPLELVPAPEPTTDVPGVLGRCISNEVDREFESDTVDSRFWSEPTIRPPSSLACVPFQSE